VQPSAPLAHLNAMNRTSMAGSGERQAGATGGFCRRLPEVSVNEREFWRRAVAEERERLDLASSAGSGAGRRDAH
jgi:hypothetical protein